jgi:hypothetical protein
LFALNQSLETEPVHVKVAARRTGPHASRKTPAQRGAFRAWRLAAATVRCTSGGTGFDAPQAQKSRKKTTSKNLGILLKTYVLTGYMRPTETLRQNAMVKSLTISRGPLQDIFQLFFDM